MHQDHTFWPWHGFGMFPGFFLLLCLIIVFLIARKIGSNSLGGNSPSSPNIEKYQTPIEILKTRYAKGEIDQEEFEKMKKTISEQ